MQDAIAWLTDGTAPPPGGHDPGNGESIETPERYLIRSYSRTKDGTRRILFSKWRFGVNESMELSEGWRGLSGSRIVGTEERWILVAKGKTNTRRYHAWYSTGTDGKPTGPLRLYRYETPLGELEETDNPPKTEITLNAAQYAVLIEMEM